MASLLKKFQKNLQTKLQTDLKLQKRNLKKLLDHAFLLTA